MSWLSNTWNSTVGKVGKQVASNLPHPVRSAVRDYGAAVQTIVAPVLTKTQQRKAFGLSMTESNVFDAAQWTTRAVALLAGGYTALGAGAPGTVFGPASATNGAAGLPGAGMPFDKLALGYDAGFKAGGSTIASSYPSFAAAGASKAGFMATAAKVGYGSAALSFTERLFSKKPGDVLLDQITKAKNNAQDFLSNGRPDAGGSSAPGGTPPAALPAGPTDQAPGAQLAGASPVMIFVLVGIGVSLIFFGLKKAKGHGFHA